MNKRLDQAQYNREQLLNAALHVFRQHGIHAPLQRIIDQAQVGRATFYRNFADRRALVLAMMQHALQRLDSKAQYYSQFPDGFIRLIESHVHNLPYLTALMEYWRVIPRDDPDLQRLFAQRDQILQPLIEQAIAHGVCRPDLTTEDYGMISAILRASFQGLNEPEQIQLAKRALELLIHGIRAYP
ncbi:TetR/AcrR family transcriptional regulator [Acinetobacter larvae]|uniref:TetR family transcriptional regulator n=1 Tax=Acinetobacter larvae TaxID=1789224 RepID=A0A1B2LWT2_9GAMM|nr:TetR/AcrR family transcriptional regulator [Acinetobacter larvae]AOA57395.1 TetR family transcriptional regulator [Acinetobacter larvae]